MTDPWSLGRECSSVHLVMVKPPVGNFTRYGLWWLNAEKTFTLGIAHWNAGITPVVAKWVKQLIPANCQIDRTVFTQNTLSDHTIQTIGLSLYRHVPQTPKATLKRWTLTKFRFIINVLIWIKLFTNLFWTVITLFTKEEFGSNFI